MNKFTGVGVAIVTPFLENGEVDFESLQKMIDHVIAEGTGVDYIVVLGTTGESATLSDTERQEIFVTVRQYVAGRVPLVAGIGGNATAKVIHELKSFDLSGYDAILSVCPYYNKPTQEGIFRHYQAIAQQSPLPVILYNVPSRTAVNMTAETTIRLSHVPNIIGIKEASGNLEQIKTIIDGSKAGFWATSGDDMQTPEIISLGGVGAISVLANAYPTEFSAYAGSCISGKPGIVTDWEKLQQLNQYMYVQGNPVGIKALLSCMGICTAHVRLPLVPATADLVAQISKLL